MRFWVSFRNNVKERWRKPQKSADLVAFLHIIVTS